MSLRWPKISSRLVHVPMVLASLVMKCSKSISASATSFSKFFWGHTSLCSVLAAALSIIPNVSFFLCLQYPWVEKEHKDSPSSWLWTASTSAAVFFLYCSSRFDHYPNWDRIASAVLVSVLVCCGTLFPMPWPASIATSNFLLCMPCNFW